MSRLREAGTSLFWFDLAKPCIIDADFFHFIKTTYTISEKQPFLLKITLYIPYCSYLVRRVTDPEVDSSIVDHWASPLIILSFLCCLGYLWHICSAGENFNESPDLKMLQMSDLGVEMEFLSVALIVITGRNDCCVKINWTKVFWGQFFHKRQKDEIQQGRAKRCSLL